MEQFFGTVFLFTEKLTGQTEKIWTDNGHTWFKKGMSPVVDEDLQTTDEMEEVDHAIAHEALIQKFVPIDPKAKAFVSWCMERLVLNYEEKIEAIRDYQRSLV